MIYKIIFTIAGIYSAVYTVSYIVYEYRGKRKRSVFGNALLILTAIIVYASVVGA